MKLIKLIAVFALVGCGGEEFTSANKITDSNEAGASSAGESGEAGADNTAGISSGGSSASAGNSAGGTAEAGKDTGGSFNGGSSAGTDVGGATSGMTGSSTAGSGGTSVGMAGSGNTCTSAGKAPACSDSKYNDYPAAYIFECTESTNEPPSSIIVPEGDINTWRQCVESSFGSPATLWCCTRG